MSRSTVSIAIRNNRTFLPLLVPTAGFCCLTSDYPQIMIRWCFKDQVILTILSVLIRWIPSSWSLPIKKTAQVSLTVENQTNQSWLMDVKGTVFENHRKKSHSTLRAKRATIFSYLNINPLNPNGGPFWRVFENLKLAVKHCDQTGQF